MQKINTLAILSIGVLVVCGFLFAGSVSAAEQTFVFPQIVEFLPGGGDWSAYCSDTATATQFCKMKGFDNYTNYGKRYIGPKLDNDYVLQWNGSSFVQVGGNGCSTVIDPSITCSKTECTSHASKQCSGNSVYWYDSCGTKQDIYQACTSSQTCSNGSCQNITCSSNSDCGTNAYTGGLFCQGNSVYQNYTTHTCSNPGTTSSTCSASTEAKLKNTCSSGQTCSNGSCANITCDSNSDCGTNAYTGSPFCQLGDVYQNYTTHTCNNPGTANSTCSASTEAKLKNTCSNNQTCSNGSCGNTCAYHSYQQCSGNSVYWYDSCGTKQDLAQYCQYGCENGCCIQQNIAVQTNSATNVNNNQTTLNGYLSGINSNGSCNSNYVWFQWGTTTSYGNETYHQLQNSVGSFSQAITNISSNNTYHFRAVAQGCSSGIVYGQDMTFASGYSGNLLTVNKTAKNLTSGNSGWSSTVYANPSDTLMFMITIQANSSQDVHNVYVRDTFPANLIYKNQMVVSGSSYNNYGDITSGINLGTILAGQTVTITYQAQVSAAQNFSYGTTTLNNSVAATSSGSGYNQTGNASIVVTRTAVLGATTISTGLTDNFLVDSFFLPLMIALAGLWMFRSGMFGPIERWADNRKRNSRSYKAEKELNSRIAEIRATENI